MLIRYIDFHWDNYQGGSGKTIESYFIIDVPDTLTANKMFDYMHDLLSKYVESRRPFQSNYKYTVKSVELI